MRYLLRANISIQTELAPGELLVEADSGQIEQVVTNLALNAADAMPDGGSLTIRTGRQGQDASLEVEDRGTGIPDELRERIFEPFFTTKGTGHGTGLGLSVVHGIVTSHGGRIEVSSTLGEGSRFRILLPISRRGRHEAAELPDEYPDAVPEGWGESILVVEDETGAREGLRDIMRLLGYRVTTAASGEEALELPLAPAFDLLLTDVMLPGVPGPEVARALRERWPGLKVILMSGYAEDEAVRPVVTTGMVRFLQKPFDMATLSRELQSALKE